LQDSIAKVSAQNSRLCEPKVGEGVDVMLGRVRREAAEYDSLDPAR
jgi:hypothetical protein